MKQVIVVIFLLLCGGIVGVFVGQKTAPILYQQNICQPASSEDIDDFYSNIVGVTEEQKKKLRKIEREYQNEKEIYTLKMNSANNRLADVLEHKGYQAPEISSIVMEIHSAMGVLQNLSLKHLADLETVLTKEQAAILKKYAVQRLRQN